VIVKEISTEAAFRELIDYHNANSQYVVLDTETTGLCPHTDRIVNVQMSGPESSVCFIENVPLLGLTTLRKDIILVGHNLKFDQHFLYRSGIDLTDYTVHDTLNMHHLLDETPGHHKLDDIVKDRYQDDFKEQFWRKYKTYEEAPRADRIEYSCKDVYYTNLLYVAFQRELEAEAIPVALGAHVSRLQKTLLRAEIAGLKVDKEYLINKGVTLKAEIELLKPKMRELVLPQIEDIELEKWSEEIDKRKTDKGKANVKRPLFSFDSNQQLQSLLYTKLKLPVQKSEITRNPTVDDAALEKLNHPVVEMLRTYRDYAKIYGTYIEGTLERMKDGRIYPSFNASGTVTGRLSHSNPNLGNLPKTGGIRAMYVPDDGYVFISADYSSLEVVIEANLTDDPNLVKIITEGASKHDITAQALGISRDKAKTLNFANQYHCTPWKISKILGVNKQQAEEVFKKYWETYSGPKKLKDETDREVETKGYVTNMIGRKRRFTNLGRPLSGGDFRQAYNFKVQGPGGDFTNMASYLVDDKLRERGIGRFVASIHDELLIQAKKEHAKEAEEILISTMEGISDIFNLKYRLKAVSSGGMTCWQD